MEVHNITIAQQLMFLLPPSQNSKPEIQTSISVEVTINEGTKVGITAAANKERNVLHFYFKTSPGASTRSGGHATWDFQEFDPDRIGCHPRGS